MIIPAASINVLPIIGSAIQIYFTVILDDNSFNQATINSITILYGDVNINGSIFIPKDEFPIASLVNATLDTIAYIDILYIQAINAQFIPNNYALLKQGVPMGIFSQIDGEIQGDILASLAKMFDDYYLQYLDTYSQVYSTEYTPQLEFEYNGTVGLLSNSVYPNSLFQLLAQMITVNLKVYDLELFLSKYIYYRLGTISAVFIDDGVEPPNDYWQIGIHGKSELGVTTKLAPPGFYGPIINLVWTIFNATDFTLEFQQELENLVIRISRADIGNTLIFNNNVHPNDESDFTLIGYTYPNDPRLLYDRCLEYIGDNVYPLNIVGYQRTY